MKKKLIIGTTLALLMTLTSCGGNTPSSTPTSVPGSDPTSVPSEQSEPTSATSEKSEEPSSTPSSESISTPMPSSGSEESETSDESADEPTKISVAEAIEISNSLSEGTWTMDSYFVSGYITVINSTEELPVKTITFTISDSKSGENGIICKRLLAEDEIEAQEYVVGAKVGVEGKISNDAGSAAIIHGVVDLLESVLVDATSISIESPQEIMIGKKATLKVEWLPSNGRKKALTWSSSQPTIASIDSATGEITPVALGTTIITAQCESFQATCVLTVIEDGVAKAEIKFNAYTGSEIPTSTCKAENVISQIVGSGAKYLESCAEAVNVYIQPSCMRLGNSQKTGSVSFKLKEPIKAKSVIISAQKYSSDVTTINFAATGFSGELEFKTVTSNSKFLEYTYELNDSTITDFTLSNSYKRLFIESVAFVLAD